MQTQELPARDYLAHLRRHPTPEIIDDECLAALASIEAQYGDTISHGAGLEVRIGEDARYVDYIMNIDEQNLPGIDSLWYEIDYSEFRKANETGGKISPCLFANTSDGKSCDAAYWDALLPPFLGETRANNLRAAFDRVIEKLPEGAYIKQIGTMTGRGEITIMRLVIMFPIWEAIPDGLAAIGWQGDTTALRSALAPWRETQTIAVNIDLGEKGVLPKIGVEVFSHWRHPLLVDKFITHLETTGLCLKSKGDALRRWIRIRPDGDPFIQPLIAYFKLNYKNGKIAEAKAYLEQSPYIHHHYFDAYERPTRLDMELKSGESVLPADDVLALLSECAENRVRHVRLYGGETYEHMKRVLEACRESGIKAEVVLSANAGRQRLAQIIGAGADSFLVEIKALTEKDAGVAALSLFRELKFPFVRVKWFLHAGNAGELSEIVRRVEELGAAELVITGFCADEEARDIPSRAVLEQAAKFIKDCKAYDNDENENGMKLSVDTCFSPLRAVLGGEDPTKNPNRGIDCGCEAGRSFCAVRADGKFSPCLRLSEAGEKGTLVEYWKESRTLQGLREAKPNAGCKACVYVRRCRPCPAVREKIMGCLPSGHA